MKKNFGEKLKALRVKAGLSQADLAEKLNMTQRKLSYLECGKCSPSMTDIVLICKYFGVTSDSLLGIKR